MKNISSYRIFVIFLAAGLVLQLPAKVVKADVPHLIQYQGRLTDDAGNPLDTTVDMTFAIYNDSLGSVKLWEEVHSDVTVAGGLLHVLLGQTTVIGKTIFDGSKRWLGISIDDGDVMQPMTPIVSSGYSFRSQYSDTASYATNARHSDTAAVALNAGSSGWIDAGNEVYLSTPTDSVGIGVTNPGAPLEVEGPAGHGHAIIANSHGSGTAAGVLGTNDSDGFGLMGVSNDGRGVTGLSMNGFGGHFYGPKNYFNKNLGIGTETPTEMLHIYTNASGGTSFLKLQTDHASNWGETGLRFQTPQNIWHFRMDDDANNNMPAGGLSLRSGDLDAEVMTWAENGHVGIGTNGPNYPLEVVSSSNTLRARCTGSGIGLYASSSSGFGIYSDATKNFMGGSTGFGTSDPTHRVTVNGALALQQSGTTKFHMNYYGGGFNISETTVADYRFFIKAGGNVGIGTSNPTTKLHVNGTITANGMLSTSMTDEAGLAANLGGNTPYLGSSWTTVRSRTIVVPGPGYVVAISTAYAYVDHTVSGDDKVEYGIWFDSWDFPEDERMWLRFADNADAGSYHLPIAASSVFEVTTAGTYDYYLLARRAQGDNYMWIGEGSLILMYFPTAYGTVTVAGKSSEDSSPPPPEQHAVAEESAEPNISDISDRVESLMAELEALKRRLEAVENK